MIRKDYIINIFNNALFLLRDCGLIKQEDVKTLSQALVSMIRESEEVEKKKVSEDEVKGLKDIEFLECTLVKNPPKGCDVAATINFQGVDLE